ncbi:MAG: hypothetical protein JST90_17280 [Bacteroidetes bacterium]|nr:hypothetical protein [Bacteroidota bacterium]
MRTDYRPKEREWFISLAYDFKDTKLLRAQLEKEDNDRLYAAYMGDLVIGEGRKFIKKPIEEFAPPYYPAFLSRREGTSDIKNEFQTYLRISEKVEDILLKDNKHSELISVVIKQLIESGETEDDSIAIVKVLLCEPLLYVYKELKSGEYISFHKLKTEAELSTQYYGSLADEVRVKSEKISFLVSHGQTVGNYREVILRELLKKYIPKKFAIATGFIEGLSKQIDIIIYDSHNHSPTFIEGELVVVKREAVRAIIEVKSTLDSTNLKESLQDFYNITRGGIFKPTIPVFKGIFAFDSTYSNVSSLANSIRDFYTKPFFVEEVQHDMINRVQYLFQEITSVTVLNKFGLISQYYPANGKEEDNLIPQLFSISDRRKMDVQSAMFIATIFDYLDVDLNAKKSFISAFSRIYGARTVKYVIEAKLTDDTWIPSTKSNNEHDFTQESVKKRLSKLALWFAGKLSSHELLIEEDREDTSIAPSQQK